MLEVIFDVETITPLFLAGADQETAELRAPSFRGVMRYWLRALMGGMVGTDAKGLEGVRKKETEVFGATDRGSTVSINVSAISGEPKKFDEQISRRVGGQWQATGKGYLLWSMAESGRADKGNLKPARWYFTPGTNFQIALSAKSLDDTKLKEGIATFWLLTQLGSIGSRSHRCAGSLGIRSVINNITNLQFITPNDVEELQRQLQTGIENARTLYDIQRTTVRNAVFDTLSQQTCRIKIFYDPRQPWLTHETAMKAIGESLQSYRSSVHPLQRRTIFGLPLKNVSNDRRTSPLLLRVTRLQNGRYVCVATLFKTAGQGIAMADYGIIEQWMQTGFPQALEVML